MAGPAVETPEYHKMLTRMIRAYGRRVGEADPEDLATMVTLRDDLNTAIEAAVAGQRKRGASWAEVARGLRVTRQAAQMRYGGTAEDLANARAFLNKIAAAMRLD